MVGHWRYRQPRNFSILWPRIDGFAREAQNSSRYASFSEQLALLAPSRLIPSIASAEPSPLDYTTSATMAPHWWWDQSCSECAHRQFMSRHGRKRCHQGGQVLTWCDG